MWKGSGPKQGDGFNMRLSPNHSFLLLLRWHYMGVGSSIKSL